MNRVVLTGRLTRDPEIRFNQSNSNTTARFSVAVQRPYKNQNGTYDADFINCVLFGKSTEFLEKYFKKGDGIEVEGSIHTGSYTNKDGVRVYTTDVYADRIGFALTNNRNGGTENEIPASAPAITEEEEDGLPFA